MPVAPRLIEEACHDPLPGAPTLDKAAREELLRGSLEEKDRGVKQWALRAVESILAGPSKSKYKRLGMGGSRDTLTNACSPLSKRHARALERASQLVQSTSQGTSQEHPCAMCPKICTSAQNLAQHVLGKHLCTAHSGTPPPAPVGQERVNGSTEASPKSVR